MRDAPSKQPTMMPLTHSLAGSLTHLALSMTESNATTRPATAAAAAASTSTPTSKSVARPATGGAMVPLLRSLFVMSGLMNILGMLVVSKGFSNTLLYDEYPEVFGLEGCLCIMLWGLAYIAVAPRFTLMPALCLVFALEKLLYTATWLLYMQRRYATIVLLFHKDWLTGSFYYLYGVNDLFFAVVFVVAFIVASRSPAAAAATKSKSE